MGKVISFFNFKGGVGKTAIAVLFADYLAYRREKNVLVIDMDNPMFNFSCRRNEDLSIVDSDKTSVLARTVGNKKPFDIFKIKGGAEYTDLQTDKIYKAICGYKEKYDYIILDFPGHYTPRDLSKILLYKGIVDLLVIPINTGTQSQSSAVKIIEDTHCDDYKLMSGMKDGQPTVLLWNKLTKADRKNKPEFKNMDVVNNTGVEFIKLGINEIESLSDKKDPQDNRFIYNTLCYPQANISRICGYIEKIFAEIKIRLDGKWSKDIELRLYGDTQ